MSKDTDQELARLEAELLKAELEEEEYEEDYEEAYEEEYEEYDEEYDEEAEEDLPPEYYYTDTRSVEDPDVYQNYSNGYRAYNNDQYAEDLDAFSEDVYEEEPDRSYTGLIILCCLLAVIAAVGALFLLLRYRGIL